MARFDDLPADQKAVLQLVLKQGRSYDQIAGVLKISAAAVRDRAHLALDALGPSSTSGLSDERQSELGDYLLGQQDEGERLTTYAFLDGSAAGRAWARVVGGELRGAGLADSDTLPEVPADGTDTADREAPAPTAAPAKAPTPAAPTAPAAPAAASAAAEAGAAQAPGDPASGAGAPARARGGAMATERVSRTGGIILLGAVAAALIVGLLAILGVFGGGSDNKKSAAATTTQTQTQTTTTGQPRVEAQINLRSTQRGSKALAVANIVSQGGQRALAVIGQGLAPGNRYVLWLAKGGSSKFLGFFPAVPATGKTKGRLQGLVAAPSDLANFDTLLISRETTDQPKAPGDVILRGTIPKQ